MEHFNKAITDEAIEHAARTVSPRWQGEKRQQQLLAAIEVLMLSARPWYINAGLLFLLASDGRSWHCTGANRCTCKAVAQCYHYALRDLALELKAIERASRPANHGLPPGIALTAVLALATELERDEGLSADEAYQEAINTLVWEQCDETTEPDAPEPMSIFKTAWGLVITKHGRSLTVRNSELATLRQVLGAA